METKKHGRKLWRIAWKKCIHKLIITRLELNHLNHSIEVKKSRRREEIKIKRSFLTQNIKVKPLKKRKRINGTNERKVLADILIDQN